MDLIPSGIYEADVSVLAIKTKLTATNEYLADDNHDRRTLLEDAARVTNDVSDVVHVGESSSVNNDGKKNYLPDHHHTWTD